MMVDGRGLDGHGGPERARLRLGQLPTSSAAKGSALLIVAANTASLAPPCSGISIVDTIQPRAHARAEAGRGMRNGSGTRQTVQAERSRNAPRTPAVYGDVGGIFSHRRPDATASIIMSLLKHPRKGHMRMSVGILSAIHGPATCMPSTPRSFRRCAVRSARRW